MELNFAICTDLHFGPEMHFHGKLRKLTAHAGRLLGRVIDELNQNSHLDLVVNLGDDIEDESHAADLARYRECLGVLDTAKADRLHVAGNHDVINLSETELSAEWDRSAAWAKPAWEKTKKLYYSLDRSGVHLVVLHTHEVQDRNITIEDEQLAWLEKDLASTSLPSIVLMHHSAADQYLGGNRWFEGRSHVCLVRERKELRGILERHTDAKPGSVLGVFNGHLHWNHLDVIRGIPYVTVQSLIENLDDDAPGRPAGAFALVKVTRSRVLVDIRGVEPARYQFDRHH